jgi:Leucine-rich repeat (LRR) protein
LWDNHLNGTLPIEIGSSSSLIKLILGNCPKGTLPFKIVLLSGLIDIEANGNLLSGSIPTSIGNLRELLTLYLSINILNGTLPSEIGNLSNLVYFDVKDNLLTGSFPQQLCQNDLEMLCLPLSVACSCCNNWKLFSGSSNKVFQNCKVGTIVSITFINSHVTLQYCNDTIKTDKTILNLSNAMLFNKNSNDSQENFH